MEDYSFIFQNKLGMFQQEFKAKEQITALQCAMLKTCINEFATDIGLTPRETEILFLLTQNITHLKDMAEHLGLSQSTINNHLNNIYTKVRVKSKAQLIAKCFGYISQNFDIIEKQFDPPRILIIDDEVDICEQLSIYFQDMGMQVLTLSSPERALDVIEEHNIDIVLTDIQTPKMSGLDFYKNFKIKFPNYPIIVFFTGFPDKYATQEIFQSQEVLLLKKPLKPDSLYHTLMDNYLNVCKKRQIVCDNMQPRCKMNKLYEVPVEKITQGGLIAEIPNELVNNPEFAPGKDVELEVLFSSQIGALSITGVVTWKRTQDIGSKKPAIFLKFKPISSRALRHIESYIRASVMMEHLPKKPILA